MRSLSATTIRTNVWVLLAGLLLLQTTLVASRGFDSKAFAGLRHSPVGIGFGRALSNRRRFDVSTGKSGDSSHQVHRVVQDVDFDDDYDDEEEMRNAAIQQEDAQALRRTAFSHLVIQRRSEVTLNDELEWLEDKAVPCSTKAPPKSVASVASTASDISERGGAALARPLFFWENMICGAVSRSIAQTIMHPANTMKTILQSSRGADRPTLGQLMRPSKFRMLTRGAGANFVLSCPHGAVNFAVLEFVRAKMNQGAHAIPALREKLDSIGPALDFTSSAISTICCSVVSTPQMMITDNIMAGNYPNLSRAVKGLYADKGVLGFYGGWWPGLVGKIPSYALTWTFFQQLKRVRDMMSDRPAKNIENTVMGCIASTTTVCIMIPMDTVKTRLVTQMSNQAMTGTPYKGIVDCAVRIAREEGIKTFYRGLPPRLLSVVPMIGIQFGVYEAMKNVMLSRSSASAKGRETHEETIEEAAIEATANTKFTLPVPRPLQLPNDKPKESLEI